VATMDSVALRLSPHQGRLWNPVWIRSTAWRWPVLLLLSVELDSDSDSESPRGVREAEPVDVIVKGAVEVVPAATRWM
jgi:hypothetical protein